MRKLITSIGTNNYSEARYQYGKEYHDTKFAPIALIKWFCPDEVIILLTDLASKNDNWREMNRDLQSNAVVYRPVLIPDGKSEQEIWQIFSVIAENLSDHDEIILDITHGLRSLPFLALFSAIYMRAACKVNLRGIYYGAFEAKNDRNEVPFFDLTSFLDLIDWASATDRLIDAGDAKPLAYLIKESVTTNAPWINVSREQAKLVRIAGVLDRLSMALSLNRLEESAASFQNLKRLVSEETEGDSVISRSANPFRILTNRLIESYGDFEENTPQNQLTLIKWHLRNNSINSAVLLAREWLITLSFQFYPGPTEYDVKNFVDRKKVAEELLYKESRINITRNNVELHELRDCYQQIWNIRNDIAHCLENSNNSVNDIVRRIRQVISNMEEIGRRFFANR
jgi:CRISPR-associated DxTHG motif protein